MDDHAVLQHLLSLENEAAALVDDAQAEADKRVSEGEKQCRARYEEVYALEVQALEESCARNIADIKENYRKQLDEYGDSLNAIPLNRQAFSSLAETLLFKGVLPGGKP